MRLAIQRRDYRTQDSQMVGKFFKVIETKYNGYKFRSRLEARWAVFFDTLNIEYRYESEGYSLEGTPYLPDFWLPKQDCFVEIKGEKPTEEEMQKAKLLSLYTGKYVFVFYGNIKFPHEDKDRGTSTFGFTDPGIFATSADESTEIEVHTAREVLVLFQKLKEADLEVEFENGQIFFRQTEYTWEINDADQLAHVAQSQHVAATQLIPLLRQHKDDIAAAITVEEGWTVSFVDQLRMPSWKWYECSQCGDLIITFSGYNKANKHYAHLQCLCSPKGTYIPASPRLIAAYTAARQARF